MALKSDALGFLQGEPVGWGRAIKLWCEIRDEVHALRQSLSGSAAQAKRMTSNSGGRTPNVAPTPRRVSVDATPRMRDERG
ncbi:hypothetical protein ACXX82_19580 [Glaciimonas sp. GNP009]